MKWAHDKAKCGKCGYKIEKDLRAEKRVRNHQNSKHQGSGKILFYDTLAGEWEE